MGFEEWEVEASLSEMLLCEEGCFYRYAFFFFFFFYRYVGVRSHEAVYGMGVVLFTARWVSFFFHVVCTMYMHTS